MPGVIGRRTAVSFLDLMGMRGTAAKHPSPVYLLLLRQRRQACCHPDFSGRMQTTTMLS